MNEIPKNFYRYKQSPIWENTTIPSLLLGIHNTKKGVYGKINVLEGSLEYNLFNIKDGTILSTQIVEGGNFIVANPQEWHSIKPRGKVRIFIDFYKEKSINIQKLENAFSHKFPDKSPHYEVQLLGSLLEETKLKSVVDIGSGGGRNSFFLANQGLTITAIDKNIQGLLSIKNTAQESNFAIHTQEKDLNSEYIDTYYDSMISTVVLQFLEKKAAHRLLESMKKYTVKGGYNLIIAPIISDDIPVVIDFPNLLSYDEYLNYYHDWKIIHSDNFIGQFHRKDETRKYIKSRFATILAQKL